MRAPLPGLIEVGWYEGELMQPGAGTVRVRLDAQGNGRTDPAAGKSRTLQRHHLVEEGRQQTVQGVSLHRLQPGDLLWPGQVLAWLRADEVRSRLDDVEDQLTELESRGERSAVLARRRERLREQLAQAVVLVPDQGECWMAVEVCVSPLQAVGAGELLATIVPVDPHTHQPLELIARLDVDEKHWADLCSDLAGEQAVRIYSNVFNHRHHGRAEARIERLEPWGEPTANGERHFHALAPITRAPYVLPLGSSFKAEIVVGRKLVYRIILEH